MMITSLLISTVFHAGTSSGYTPRELWDLWPEQRFISTPAPCLHHAELVEHLQRLEHSHPEEIQLEEIGRSFEDRPLFMFTLGRGSKKVLIWSQMHGNEPSATPALFDLAHFLLTHREEPAIGRILEELTLMVVPMLNPDGAEIYQRRNAQGIDINRDALNLATPEGRTLKRVRDQHEPFLAFSMHDQNRRTLVGDTGVLSSNAVLAVAGDEENTVTPGRLRAMRACSAIVTALQQFIPDGVARYDDDWNPRAFGDNVTAWGTPVVTHESGGLPPGRDLTELTRLSFVSLSTVLQELVKNDLADHDPETYRSLPRTRRGDWSDVVIVGGRLLQPGTTTPYRADLAFDVLRGDRQAAGCDAEKREPSQIVEIGDGRYLAAGQKVDVGGRILMAPFVAGVDGWKVHRWLDEEALDRLGRHGVGTVVWRVPDGRFARAQTRARELSLAGRPHIVVRHENEKLPWLVVTEPPRSSESRALYEAIAALLGTQREDRLEGLSDDEVLILVGDRQAGLTKPPPAFWPGAPASFLLVAAGDEIDLRAAKLEQIWLDGVRLEH